MREAKINNQIKADKVRLIDENGKQLGIIGFNAAMEKAAARSLDLVLMAEEAKPPVCKLLDYKKFAFDRKKQKGQAKKKHRRTHIKEVKFRLGTEEGDYQVKLKNLIRFLSQGDKVKISLRFRGREVIYKNQGFDLLNKIKGDIGDYAEVEQEAKMEGRQLIALYKPSIKKQTKIENAKDQDQ